MAAQEQIDLRADGAELLSRLADGALRDALSLLDQCAASGGVIDARAVLDTLGLAGNLQTAELMRRVLAEDAQGALLLLNDLYAGGKDMGAVLSGLSTLGRDLLIRMTAPKGGSALLSGGYDEATMEALSRGVSPTRLIAVLTTLQDTSANLLRSTNLRTDAELCILKLCDQSLSGDLTALAARVKKLERAMVDLSRGGLTAVPVQAAGRANRPIREELSAEHAPAEDDAPWEEPPMPTDADDPGAPEDALPVFAAPGAETHAAPEKAESVRAVPRDNTPPPPPPREVDDRWPELLEQFKARLPMAKRAFLNMAGGRLEGDQLLIECDNDLVKNTLSKEDVLAVFREVAAQVLGCAVAVQVVTKETGPSPARPAAVTPAAAEKRPARPDAPAEESTPLEHLLSKMQGFDNFKIQ